MSLCHPLYSQADTGPAAMKKLHIQLKQTPQSLTGISALLIAALLSSGCSFSSLQQREQAITSQQQQLSKDQQKLETEKKAIKALRAELKQEQNRLEVLKKQPASHTQDGHTSDNNRVIIGEAEHVYISPPDVKLSARIDTGAKTSSLNAVDLVEFERDGKPYARFNIIDPTSGKKVEIERRIKKRIRIKEHEGESQRRPIVKMRVRLGKLDQRIEMSLTDRSDFEHQVLIGRNFLRDFAIVDVSKKYISQPVIENN